VLCYELCSGFDLHKKDLNDDLISSAADRELLSSWSAPTPEQLDHVLGGLHDNGLITTFRWVVARDLVLWCLQGNPRMRPRSMEEVLSHRFFGENDLVLPSVPPHLGIVDCMISYQSTQVVQMQRLRLFFRSIGLRTADGTEVSVCD